MPMDKEWVGQYLTVTYSPTNSFQAERTAFNSSGKAVGGGASTVMAGVARVIIVVPQKYAGQNLRVSCKDKGYFS